MDRLLPYIYSTEATHVRPKAPDLPRGALAMNHLREEGFSPEKLPKSVKVRSTCNACQQAKIRCSHDRPSCKRCQRHNIDCVYSISRRLGRPAKKKDTSLDNSPTCQTRSDNQLNKKVRPKKKKRIKDEPTPDFGSCERSDSREGNPLFDTLTVGQGHLDNLAVEDSLWNPAFVDIVTAAPFSFSDNIDMASDSWLHEFMSNPFTDPAQDHGLEDPFAGDDVKIDDTTSKTPIDLDNLPVQSDSISDATSEAHDLLSSSYSAGANGSVIHSEALSGTSQEAFQSTPVFTENFKQELFSWPQPCSALGHDFPTEPSSLFPPVNSVKRAHDYSFSGEELRASSRSLSSNCRSQAHQQTIRDLNRVNFCASRTGPAVTIDSILTCQRVLQQLTESILQCRVCSQERVNLLMFVIVSIDSLITTLDAITSGECDVVDRLFPECFSPLVQDYRSDSAARWYRRSNMQLKSQLEACPLVVGGFCVPAEEKFLFVRRVLHSRLSGLLGTVHRIRLCTQESLAPSASRGRLEMMRETDQRLKMIIMKLNMMTRP
ncbi:Zn(II)2Cys6 transcription factor domain-containing protein [Aspergillus lucknowensis]|uniref:Zn(2)-C6 fungal-type domain-containing protein n=1 Tax=Aspergillus lucknowensis TaxID=176173 RepID=A0ABR4LU24_9EURO